ncbi:sensor histidine kinase [Pseudoxanthomonas taiwanensis]|jgi:Predicted signal transduction protein with a C-terminal ATPase domain|uniref:Sensor histidine kinase n=1 Tax=Pseudoxanthomonas taiwanensis TaxID=176598 RepID=A0A921TF82_9GAMM|nr:histidine kinase [Pseudoxanthomonas taiwanensis]KAF1686776.1 sensor histidine kinase [Pseudoxanthomonas taiwanensis]MBO2468648.1 sensor histidine kinase [Xanthomonadaceae bacterium]
MGACPGYSLGRSLPPEVLVGGNTVWSRYRQYPVFSLRWLAGRSRLFCGVIAVVAAFLGAGIGLVFRDAGLGVHVALVQFLAFSLMATLGPALATWVRHRGWPEPRERVGVVLAVLAGVVLSLGVDHITSGHIDALVKPHLPGLHGGAEPRPPDLGPVLGAVTVALNILALLVVYGLFGGGLALRAYFSERRRWEEHRHARELEALAARVHEADLRLGVLQAQVEPHFLFNTLASVRALVRQDPAQAEATLDALVAFLRAAIPRLRGDHRLLSTLGQQLDLCARYLELMRVRMGGRLSFVVEAEEALRALPFPPSLLITLVENAIKHGIEPRPGPGRVEVRASGENGRLRVAVMDDGAGLQPGLGGGMGLANVREQLAHRFGAGASLHLEPRAGGGVVAWIEVPVAALAGVPA